jgi:hypothetical protein
MTAAQVFDYNAFMRESEILLAYLQKLEDGEIQSLPQLSDEDLADVLADLPDLDRLRQIEDGLITLPTIEPPYNPPIPRRQKGFNLTNQD